jgi:dihydroorotate dehydrogenase
MKTKYETDFLNTRKIAEDNLLNQINLENSPDDQSLKNALLAKAKSEMQKVQQLVIANDKNEELNTRYNKELKKDVTLKNNLEINKKIPSKKLLDRIQSNQDYLDDLTIKIDSVTTNIGASEIDIKAAISELRKVDPKAAASLENSLNLKKKNKETREINKKRI